MVNFKTLPTFTLATVATVVKKAPAPLTVPSTAIGSSQPSSVTPASTGTPSTGYPGDFANVSPAPADINPDIPPIQVTQTPLRTFLGDIVIPAGVTQNIDIHTLMGSNCVGFVLIPNTVAVKVNVNGGGFRSVPSAMVVDEATINNLTIQTFADGAVLQLNGA